MGNCEGLLTVCVPRSCGGAHAHRLSKAMRTKKVSFFAESVSEERVPLLTTSDSTTKDGIAAASGTATETSSSSSCGDAIVELEGLSRLLVRSCKVFTVVSCVSVLLGSVSSVQD